MNTQILQKINIVREDMKKFFKEREEDIDGMLLALLSSNNAQWIGYPGTAKSLMVVTLTKAIEGANYFERLIGKFTVPDELFGPPKISALKEDKFERKIEGKMPTAHIVFLDEIWKANIAILNSLLKVTNEKKYENDGDLVDCPLISMFCASNELPQDDQLKAIADRVMIWQIVRYIADDQNFKDMVMNDSPPQLSVSLTLKELYEAQQDVLAVNFPESVVDVLIQIRNELKKEGIEPSDRRFKNTKNIIRAFAYLQGRNVVQVEDLSILKYCLWSDPSHITKVEHIIIAISNPTQREADEVMDAIFSAIKSIEDLQNAPISGENADEKEKDAKITLQSTESIHKIKKGIASLEKLKNQMKGEGRDTSAIEKYIEKATKLNQNIYEEILGMKKKGN